MVQGVVLLQTVQGGVDDASLGEGVVLLLTTSSRQSLAPWTVEAASWPHKTRSKTSDVAPQVPPPV